MLYLPIFQKEGKEVIKRYPEEMYDFCNNKEEVVLFCVLKITALNSNVSTNEDIGHACTTSGYCKFSKGGYSVRA